VRGGGPVTDVFVGVLPFIVALLIMIVLVIVFPGIVMFVPQWLYG
jgi:C4-dicarboxylate transporter DctM subunit